MFKKIILSILYMLSIIGLIGLASAAITVNLESPTNNTGQSSISGIFKFNVTTANYNFSSEPGTHSYPVCEFYNNNSGTFSSIATQNFAFNTTAQKFTRTYSDSTLLWNVNCYPNTNNSDNDYANQNLTLNFYPTAPSITISPADNSTWSNTTSTSITITPTGASLNKCSLYADGIVNDTVTAATTTFLMNFTESSAGHTYYAACNNTAGSTTTTSTYLVKTDRTLPSAFSCTNPANLTKQSDNTPTLQWSASSDSNFANYTLSYSTSSSFATTTDIAISSASTNSYTLSALTDDTQYYWYIRAFDSAGNVKDGTNCSITSPYQYKPMGYTANLHSGWNLFGWTRDESITATALATEIGSDVTMVAKFNSTKNFQTYVVGASANSAMTIGRQEAVFIYSSVATTWPSNTFTNNATLGTFTLTNASADPWNVIPILTTTSGGFSDIGAPGQGIVNVTACTLYNNTGSTYLPWFVDEATNNGTSLKQGMAVWCELNTTLNSWDYVRTI